MAQTLSTTTPSVSKLLPYEARTRLVAAARTGPPDSAERQRAIDDAITFAVRHYPDFFKPGAI